MPTYEYNCPANGSVREVRHSIKITLETWGQLCALTGDDPGETPPEEPVLRIIEGGLVITSKPRFAPSCCGEAGCSPHH